jgi:hypothetical protein
MISGFCIEIDENFALLSYYAASSGNFFPMFWDKLLVQHSSVKNRRKLVTLVCGLNREECRHCEVLSSVVPAYRAMQVDNSVSRWSGCGLTTVSCHS